jgi:hypothetical protein
LNRQRPGAAGVEARLKADLPAAERLEQDLVEHLEPDRAARPLQVDLAQVVAAEGLVGLLVDRAELLVAAVRTPLSIRPMAKFPTLPKRVRNPTT